MSLLRRHIMMGPFWHPRYRLVLEKALSIPVVSLPSMPCMQAQNQMVIDLHDFGVGTSVTYWSSFDWLYSLADDSGSSDFGKINFINPNEVGSGTPTVTNKKGWTGIANFNHSVTTGPNWALGNCCILFYSTIGGTIPSGVEEIQQQLGANAQLVTMRHRTNPRIDFIINGTVAAVQAFPAGAAQNNAYYAVDIDGLISATGYLYRNSVLMSTIAAGGGGVFPNSDTLKMSITAPRVSGIIAGGRSFYRHNGTTNAHPALNAIFQKYMTAVQALP